MPRRARLAELVALCVLGCGAVSATEYTISTNSDLVLLDVSVKDARGGYVTGLAQDSFHVFEDRRERPITQFSNADTPVSLGLVLDNSRSMLQKRRSAVMGGLSCSSYRNP